MCGWAAGGLARYRSSRIEDLSYNIVFKLEATMQVILPLNEMTLEEKFMIIEKIWDDIIHNTPDFPSPRWHEDVLKEREIRLMTGREQLIDWEDAKRLLRETL